GRLLTGAAREIPSASNLETPQDRLACHAIAEIDDVVDDRGIARGLRIGDVGIRGSEGDVAHSLERDAVMPRVEPDQRLPSCRWPVSPRVNVHRLVNRILRRGFERVLDLVLGVYVKAPRLRVDADRRRGLR